VTLAVDMQTRCTLVQCRTPREVRYLNSKANSFPRSILVRRFKRPLKPSHYRSHTLLCVNDDHEHADLVRRGEEGLGSSWGACGWGRSGPRHLLVVRGGVLLAIYGLALWRRCVLRLGGRRYCPGRAVEQGLSSW
jgi:hypothetical protein